MARERQRNRGNAFRIGGMALALSLLAWTFRDTEWRRVSGLIAGVGLSGVVLLLPQFLSLLVESVGWRLAFASMGRRLPLLGLLRVRKATEALAQTLPLGVVFCEAMKPALLARNCGASIETSLSGMAARKWLLMGSQSIYMGSFTLLAFGALSQISGAVIGTSGLPYLLGAGCLLLFLVTTVVFAVFSRGRLAARVYGGLMCVPSERLRSKLLQSRESFAKTDGELERFFATAFASPWPLLAFSCGWFIEAIETALILSFLGVALPFPTVGALEVAASFLRNVMFMLPAGLGVQDLSYLTFLRALQVPDALNVAAAFLLLKRAKECFWAAVGYAVLLVDLRGAARVREPLPLDLPC